MLKGLYSAASAMVANMNRQTVLSHNIANLNTPGFKQLMMSLEDFKKTGVYPQSSGTEPVPFAPSVYENLMLRQLSSVGTLGLGTESSEEVTDVTQGPIQTTTNELDMAIEGEGYFTLQTPDGVRYTRDGRFGRDANNYLVNTNGYRVLDASGAPIVVPDGDVSVKYDGNIYVGTTQVARIALAGFANAGTDLTRDGDNLYQAATPSNGAASGNIHHYALEMSNVNMAQVASQMVTVTRSYEAAQQMVSIQDALLAKTISTLGRV